MARQWNFFAGDDMEQSYKKRALLERVMEYVFLAAMLGCFALFLGPRFWDILHQAERWAGHALRF